MPGNVLTTQTGLYDPIQSFAINLIPVAASASSVSGNVVTIVTATHGFGAVLTAFQKVPSYNVATGNGPQLGVIITGGSGSLILNSTWLVTSVPSATTFTILLTPAQVLQLGTSLTGATVTPFMTLPFGWWDIVAANSDVLQWCSTTPPSTPGPVGGANTTVNGVVGGSVLPFGILGNAAGAPIGGGTYIGWETGTAVSTGDSIQTDGVTYFFQFGATPGISRLYKRL